MRGRTIAAMCPFFSSCHLDLCHTPSYSKPSQITRSGGKNLYSFNPIKANILLTHGDGLLRADAKDIMEMIH